MGRTVKGTYFGGEFKINYPLADGDLTFNSG